MNPGSAQQLVMNPVPDRPGCRPTRPKRRSWWRHPFPITFHPCCGGGFCSSPSTRRCGSSIGRPGIRPGTAASRCSTGAGTTSDCWSGRFATTAASAASIRSINLEHQRQGLGRRLVRRALADGLGYTWQTSGQSPEAKQFFPKVEKETGTGFIEYGGVCEHLASPPGYISPPPGRHPRPVLERGI
jgi:hypothetical protein